MSTLTNTVRLGGFSRAKLKMFQNFIYLILSLLGFELFLSKNIVFDNKLLILNLAFITHFVLLSLSLKRTKNFTNPLVLFLCIIIIIYLIKFLLIECFEDVHVNFVILSQEEYDSLFNKCILYISLGTLFFWIGYNLKIIDPIIKTCPQFFFRRNSIKVLNLMMIFLIFVGAVSAVFIIKKKGGFYTSVVQMGEFRIASPDFERNFIYVLASYSVYGILIGPIYFISVFWDHRLVRISFFIFFICIIALLFIVTGSRSKAVAPWLSLLVVYEEGAKKKVNRIFVVSTLVVIVMLVSVMNLYRGITVSKHSEYSYEELFERGMKYHYKHIAWSIGNMFNGPSGLISAIKLVPEEFDPTLGYTFVEAFLKPLPSSLIPFLKVSDQTIGNRIARAINPHRFQYGGGFAISIYGLFYYNFMLPGIVMLSLLFGLISRFTYLYTKCISNYNHFNVCIYAILLGVIYVDFFRSGGVLRLSGYFFFFISLFFVLYIISKIMDIGIVKKH